MTSTEQWLKWESRSFTGTSYQEINEQLMHTTFSGVRLTPLSAGSTRLEHKCSALSGLQMCELANKDTSFIILPEAERCCFF